MNYQLLREQYEATKLDARIQYNVGNLVDMIATIDLDIRDQVVDELSFLLRDEEQDLLSEVYRELDKPVELNRDWIYDSYLRVMSEMLEKEKPVDYNWINSEGGPLWDKPRRFIHREGLFPLTEANIDRKFYIEWDGKCWDVYKDRDRQENEWDIEGLCDMVKLGTYREITDEPGDPFENYTTRWFVPNDVGPVDCYHEFRKSVGVFVMNDSISVSLPDIDSLLRYGWIEVFERPELASKPSKNKPSKKPTKKKAKK